jgi:hypothetical protein
MKTGQFVLNSIAAGIGNGLQRAARLRCEIGSIATALITTPIGAGQTAAIYQAVSVNGWLMVEVHADPDSRSIANALYRTAFSTDCVLFGSRHTIDAVIREFRKLRAEGLSGPLIVHNGDRVTAKILDLLLDVGDSSGFPIVLCGSRRLRQLVMAAPEGSLAEKAKSRVAIDIDLPGLSLRDARLLADELADVTKIADDLVAHCFRKSGTSVRALLAQYQSVEDAAAIANLGSVGLAKWLELSGESEIEQRKIAAPRPKAIAAGRSEMALNTAVTGASKVA